MGAPFYVDEIKGDAVYNKTNLKNKLGTMLGGMARTAFVNRATIMPGGSLASIERERLT
jgi:hypothetical protein